MAEQSETAVGASRHRVLRACEPCKNRKKRCDGTQPCATCVRYQYECYFSLESRSRLKRARIEVSTEARPAHEPRPASVSTELQSRQPAEHRSQQPGRSREAKSREAVSYGAFSRLLSGRLHANPAGEEVDHVIQPAPLMGSSAATLTSALSLDHMQRLAAHFLDSVHPVYTFARPDAVQKAIDARFSSAGGVQSHDTALFGIAVLGSLFGEGLAATHENQHATLAQNSQTCLETETGRTVTPTFNLIAALVLRTLYLRSIARPYATWISSCTTMQSIAMMETDIEDLTSVDKYQELCFEPRQTLWIARLLNTWIANEHGRPPIATPFDISLVPPPPRNPISATPEEQMIHLYHISEALRPENQSEPGESGVSIAKLAALDANQCHDGVLLSRTIMAFCFYRLLRSSETAELNRLTFNHLVEIGLDGLQAAKRLAQHQKPWWHLANVPFQFLCAMLAIDTTSSYAQLPAALKALEDVAHAMPSSTITRALNLAKKAVSISRLQKMEQLQYLDQCSESLSERTPSLQASVPSLEDMPTQPLVDGLSIPWQMSDADADAFDLSGTLDWSFLPNIDIPVFDLNA